MPSHPDTARLAGLIAAYAPHDGSFEMRVPGLMVSRFSRINKECVHALRISSLCIVAQGGKTVVVGDEVYEYDSSQMIVFSVALPVAAQVTQASPAHPYLSLRLELDPRKIAELVLKVYPRGLPPVQERSAVYLTPTEESFVDAATRLMECLANSSDAELLAPLVIDEILIRLLRSPIGVRVAQMGFAESSVNRVEKAISWLRENYSQPMKVEELAEMVHMSASSFHEHFKAVTSMSPLQYQKVLRLQQARRLMLATMMDAGTASQQVGYLSASQFSREYSRFFGSAPARDIARLRQEIASGRDPRRAITVSLRAKHSRIRAVMNMTPFTGWENFYVIVGSSAGALIGLQFVVMALVADLPRTQKQAQAGQAFATPNVVHFGAVLLLAAVVCAPWHGADAPGVIFGVLGLCGVGYVLIVTRRMGSQTAYRPEFEDWLFHSILPLVAYVTGGVRICHSHPRLLANVRSWGGCPVLLFVGIHNAIGMPQPITYLYPGRSMRNRLQNAISSLEPIPT